MSRLVFELQRTPEQRKRIQETAKWLSIVSQLFEGRMNHFLAQHGFTLAQFSILSHLIGLKGRPTTISEIADSVSVRQPAVTKTISKLEQLGLVGVKTPGDDARVRQVVATNAAFEFFMATQMSIGPNMAGAFEAIEEHDAERFLNDLKKIGRWLDENRPK